MSHHPATLFKRAVESLLAQRKLVRELSQALVSYRLRHDRDLVSKTEEAVAILVNEPLRLKSPELPRAASLATAVASLLVTFKEPQLLDTPSLVWNANQLVPGVMTTVWEPMVKERLMDLCGPLDATLERMLSA